MNRRFVEEVRKERLEILLCERIGKDENNG